MEASLALEGRFSEEGLLAMTQGEDMNNALAKALMDGMDIEGAEDIWRKINLKNAELTGKEVIDDVPVDDFRGLLIEPDSSPKAETDQVKKPKREKKSPNRVVYVDFVTFIGKKRKKVERITVKPDELDAMLAKKEKAYAQLNLFG